MTAVLAVLVVSLAGGDGLDAEAAYRAGRYEEALELYRRALDDDGAGAGLVLYNMGNCLHRLGRHAEALHHYRRAALRRPGDEELRFNIRWTEHQLGLPGPDADPGFVRDLDRRLDRVSPTAWLAIIAGLQTVALAGWVLLGRRHRTWLVLLLLLAWSGAARLAVERWGPPPDEAVVLRRLEPRAAPDTGAAAADGFLRPGLTVTVRESAGGWVRVAHDEGAGWVRRDGLGVID